MANISKPTDINKIWSASGDVLAPSDTKISQGWSVEIPPRQYFNYIDNKQDQAIAHINQHGIAEWDNVTEYQGGKSYTQGSDGLIYKAVVTSVNQNPLTDTSGTYWTLAFLSTGDSYTKTQADTKYLQRSNNGSDILNTATFLTNVGVYSKTEVDTKTTVSTAALAQGGTNNTSFLTPLQLNNAFKGVNQSAIDNGYQKLPGGMIIQWGDTGNIAGGGSVTQNFPIPFPTVCLAVTTTLGAVSNSTTPSGSASQIISASAATFRNLGTANFPIRWIAIGF